jgi:hypothetical protein
MNTTDRPEICPRCGATRIYYRGWNCPTKGCDKPATGVEARVCQDIAARQQVGLAKYGVSVEGNKGDLKYWMQNLFEELLDACIYLKRAIIEIENAEHHSNGKVDEAGQLDRSDSTSGDLPNPKD